LTCVAFDAMDKTSLQTAIAEIANLADFARRSGIHRRTLDRIKAGEANLNATTVLAIEAALKRYKPAKKPVVV
jgi:DNA-binding phage protein